MLHMRIISGPSRGRVVPLTAAGLPLSIGRDANNRVRLEHTAVSRFHCVISIDAADGGEYYVEDLGSTNGTYLNGRRVTRERLRPGDELIVASVGMVIEARRTPVHADQAPLDMALSVDLRDAHEHHLLHQRRAGDPDTSEFLSAFQGDGAVRALEMLYRADRAFNDIEEFKGLLANLLELTMDTVPATRGYIFLIQRDTGALVPYLRRPDDGPHDDGELVVSRTVLETAIAEKTAIVSDDALVDERFVHSRSIVEHAVRSAMCAPLVNRGRVLGVVYVDSTKQGAFGRDDLALFSAMALKAGVAIDNARLYDDLRSLFYNTVETLVRTIQAKDAYTCGHSTRVSRYALLTAEKLGLSAKESHQAYLASMLHDIGKIGVPDDLLNRPGKLTEEEMRQVREHVQLGASLLQTLGEMHPIVPLIRHHHEAWDGSGYPDGLKGEEIPLISRIVAVADMYDAITSDRPYRGRGSHSDAVAEIRRVSGTKLDPRVATAFLEVLHDLAPAGVAAAEAVGADASGPRAR